MEFEFDKEIDALLRQAARGGETAPARAAANAHLDADELAAFSENALPEAAKKFAVGHLADCGRCRLILSDLISLNAETAPVSAAAAAAAETPEIVSAAPLPWYRRIFAMPNLAYAMGALVLLFGGLLGVIVLQNMSGSTSSEISQSRPQMNSNAGGPSLSEESDFSAANRTANAATNTAVTTAANSVANTANTSANTAATPSAAQAPENRSVSNTASTARSQKPAETAPPSPDQPSILSASPAAPIDGADSASAAETKEQTELRMQEMSSPPAAPPPAVAGAPRPAKKPAPVTRGEDEKSTRMQKRSDNYEESRAVGGKTFRRVSGVWFDSAYTTERPTLVRRGSEDYKKLDAGLRSIAENLGGTVVVLWKNKAYRIQ